MLVLVTVLSLILKTYNGHWDSFPFPCKISVTTEFLYHLRAKLFETEELADITWDV